MSGIIKNSNSPVEATFSFKNYKFTKASIELGALNVNDNLIIDFHPSGEYNPQDGLFKTVLGFVALIEETKVHVINIKCEAYFQFEIPLEFENIPLYFYANSTAILYPYIRAFVSTLSLQANYSPIVLPTLNISALADDLQAKTVVNESLKVSSN